MRKSRILDSLMPHTRQQVLATTILRPEKAWYLTEMADFLGVSPSSIQRELASLTSAGILLKTVNGNRTYFQADPSCPIFSDLQQMLTKTVGVVELLQGSLKPLSKRILVAFVYGSIASGSETSESDVDLLVVGDVGLSDVALATKTAEQKLGRPINPTILSAPEAQKKLDERQHFITAVRRSKKLFLIGEKHELAKAFSR